MSSESDFAYSLKHNTHFIVRNVTLDRKKTIKIFNYPILYGQTRDLLAIPGIQEADIRASLLKGVLRHKLLCHDIELVSSNVDLLQFSDKQRNWLKSYGFSEGIEVGWDELDGYVQNAINTSGGGSLEPAHKTLRDLIHFIDEGPGDGFLSGAVKEILPTGSPFPTSVTWYLDSGKTLKLVEKFITYINNTFPYIIQWNMYDTDGVSLIHTVTDTITYSSAFESTRTRMIS
jgi:hypothetical protein